MTRPVRARGEALGELAPDGRSVLVVDCERTAFDAPFFGDDLAMQVARGAAHRRVAVSEALAGPVDDALPAAVLFHVGRCGSTLLARALEAGTELLVPREPPLLADALGLAPRVHLDRAKLRSAGSWYAALAAERDRRCVLKLTSTATPRAAKVAAAFPDARFYALLRDPWAVDASNRDSPAPWYWSIEHDARARATVARALRGADVGAPDPLATSAALWRSSVEALIGVGERVRWLSYAEFVDDLATTVAMITTEIAGPHARGETPEALADLQRSDVKQRPAGRVTRAPLERDEHDLVSRVAGPALSALEDAGLGHLLPAQAGG